MSTATLERQNVLQDIIDKGGPDPCDYKFLDDLATGIKEQGTEKEFRAMAKPFLNSETLLGHTYLKPYGYAGDFEIIEKIYQDTTSDNPLYNKWDKFYLSQVACNAVKNRKTYFKTILTKLAIENPTARILVLGSGPCTDIYEFFKEYDGPSHNLQFDLLDIDENAIQYAKEKNKAYLDHLNFIKANVIKYSPEGKYDLVWSAGLFDYLNDKYFSFLVKRYHGLLAENGEMIIGNFSDKNPTQDVMEVYTDWILIHRSPAKLLELVKTAGVESKTYVEQEPLGINLFVRIKN